MFLQVSKKIMGSLSDKFLELKDISLFDPRVLQTFLAENI